MGGPRLEVVRIITACPGRPPAVPKARDQWIVQGISNRVHQLLVEAGAQPSVIRANGVDWSCEDKRLSVDAAFLGLSVSEQARSIEWALIRGDPEISPSRHAGYLGGLDVSASEGSPPP